MTTQGNIDTSALQHALCPKVSATPDGWPAIPEASQFKELDLRHLIQQANKKLTSIKDAELPIYVAANLCDLMISSYSNDTSKRMVWELVRLELQLQNTVSIDLHDSNKFDNGNL